jgi:hypothetical protein
LQRNGLLCKGTERKGVRSKERRKHESRRSNFYLCTKSFKLKFLIKLYIFNFL